MRQLLALFVLLVCVSCEHFVELRTNYETCTQNITMPTNTCQYMRAQTSYYFVVQLFDTPDVNLHYLQVQLVVDSKMNVTVQMNKIVVAKSEYEKMIAMERQHLYDQNAPTANHVDYQETSVSSDCVLQIGTSEQLYVLRILVAQETNTTITIIAGNRDWTCGFNLDIGKIFGIVLGSIAGSLLLCCCVILVVCCFQSGLLFAACCKPQYDQV